MPSVKQTLILLPLLGLAAAAPVKAPRDLDTTGNGVDALAAADPYHLGEARTNDDAAFEDPAGGHEDIDNVVGAAVRRRGYVGDGVGLVAETSGKGAGYITHGVPTLWTNTKNFFHEFTGGFKQGAHKRDESGASAHAAGTLSKRQDHSADPTTMGDESTMDPTMDPTMNPAMDPTMSGSTGHLPATTGYGSPSAGSGLLGLASGVADLTRTMNQNKHDKAMMKQRLQTQKLNNKRLKSQIPKSSFVGSLLGSKGQTHGTMSPSSSMH